MKKVEIEIISNDVIIGKALRWIVIVISIPLALFWIWLGADFLWKFIGEQHRIADCKRAYAEWVQQGRPDVWELYQRWAREVERRCKNREGESSKVAQGENRENWAWKWFKKGLEPNSIVYSERDEEHYGLYKRYQGLFQMDDPRGGKLVICTNGMILRK